MFIIQLTILSNIYTVLLHLCLLIIRKLLTNIGGGFRIHRNVEKQIFIHTIYYPKQMKKTAKLIDFYELLNYLNIPTN